MYAEDLDLCWRLAQRGWRRVLEPQVAVSHVGNASGVQAWGDLRTGRWLDATYDWYRLRHGPSQTRVLAAVNSAGVAYLLGPVLARKAAGRPLQDWQRELPRAFTHHLRALLRGGGVAGAAS
ncbi:MAG: hypothetical protein DLM65_10665 [Candidatus Aeolococcus gillhamiae]|uniref:Glycosyltransferase 2-like domain-containing protein n=1 Tax=Candidatus Aeolococcus gillhamiae TaxID=3127015 RepID=A0A2W5Z2N6_9BACT|nr:MAG: hypothetical protein DLM65_10665 [Candidatus Dormibacter sp. RRmetagenome_bin12]